MKQNTKKTIYLCAAAFLLSVLSSLAANLFIISVVLMCACAGCYAIASMLSPSKTYLVVIPAAVLCAFVLSGSVPLAVISFAPFLAGISIAYSAKARGERTGAIIKCDAIVFFVVLAAAAIEFYMANGTLAASAVVNSFNEFFDTIETGIVNIYNEYLDDSILGQINFSSYTKEEFLSTLAKEAVFTAKVISPAIVITLLNIFSYISTAFFTLASRVSKTELAIPGGKWLIVPSAISSWVFLVSVFVYFMISLIASFAYAASSSGLSMFADVLEYAALNITIILVPPMFICGIRGLISKFRTPMFKRRAIVTVVIIVILVLLNPIVYGPVYAALFLALEGAWDMISYYRFKKYGKEQ